MKQTFKLTIINPKRLIALFLFPILIFLSVNIGSKSNFVFGILSFLLFLFLLRYFVIGNLTITIENDTINFEWKKKLIFNYKKIESIKESEIEKVIVSDGKFIRKIIARNRSIDLNATGIKPNDSHKLISYFNRKSKTENTITKVYSWENVPLKRLKFFYVLNWIAISGSIIFQIFIMINGFNLKFFGLFGATLMLIMYGQQIKNAIDKKNSNSN